MIMYINISKGECRYCNVTVESVTKEKGCEVAA